MATRRAGAWLRIAALAVYLGAAPRVQADAGGDAPQARLSDEQRQEVAAASHRAGVAQYSRGHYRDAIALFLEANRLRPSAAVSFNVARCYEKLGDGDNALAWYRDYLRRAGDVDDRAQVERRVHKLEAQVAKKGVQQLTVLTMPEGANLAIDGSAVGASPWTGELTPGPHSLVATLDGYEDAVRPFQLDTERARDVALTLSKRKARPAVASDAPDVQLAAQPARELPPPPLPALAPSSAPAPAPVAANPARGDQAIESDSAFVTVGWATLGAGGAALGTALVFEALRESAEHDAQHETRQIEFARDLDTMRSRQTLSRVFAGVGGLLALAGGTLLVIHVANGERAPNTQVSFSCAPGSCVASLAGRL